MGKGGRVSGWEQDKAAAGRYIPHMIQILAPYVLGEASIEDDQERNTDLITLKLEPKRIACRVRAHKYWLEYADEFTIRCSRPRGTKTELEKIVEGWGDLFLYGFSDSQAPTLFLWLLGDLAVFRRWYVERQQQDRKAPGILKRNHDGSSDFRAFAIADLPAEFILGRAP
jgi:hypothetical protein